MLFSIFFFFFQAEDGIRDLTVTGVQTCALPICSCASVRRRPSLAHELAYETDAGALLAVCRTLRDAPELRFEMLMDLAGAGYPAYRSDEGQIASGSPSGLKPRRLERSRAAQPHRARHV